MSPLSRLQLLYIPALSSQIQSHSFLGLHPSFERLPMPFLDRCCTVLHLIACLGDVKYLGEDHHSGIDLSVTMLSLAGGWLQGEVQVPVEIPVTSLCCDICKNWSTSSQNGGERPEASYAEGMKDSLKTLYQIQASFYSDSGEISLISIISTSNRKQDDLDSKFKKPKSPWSVLPWTNLSESGTFRNSKYGFPDLQWCIVYQSSGYSSPMNYKYGFTNIYYLNYSPWVWLSNPLLWNFFVPCR